jgi:hypothetical protein
VTEVAGLPLLWWRCIAGTSGGPAVLASRGLNPGPAARLERAPDKVEMTMYDADEFYFRSQDAPGFTAGADADRPGRRRHDVRKVVRLSQTCQAAPREPRACCQSLRVQLVWSEQAGQALSVYCPWLMPG